MGRTNTQLAKVKEEDLDYHIVKVKNGERSPHNWVYCATARNQLTKTKVAELFAQLKSGTRRLNAQCVHDAWYSAYGWYLVPGVKPDPRWGEVGA